MEHRVARNEQDIQRTQAAFERMSRTLHDHETRLRIIEIKEENRRARSTAWPTWVIGAIGGLASLMGAVYTIWRFGGGP